ncbi:MAG: hypothetical protein A3H29_00280 [Acidobacteria bacterium RIFCSPLOWO2_02_FULL_67_21]|nr:MAG: hypothetical protein A3H29_00280 [Acidobacteria bacterium RIFCSPLOWO2_02_FULL_67_21]
MDNARLFRLNAFAVVAFCAEMTLLPGHWSSRVVPVNTTTQTTPSRFTTGPHIGFPKPRFAQVMPEPAPAAAIPIAFFRSV